MSQQHSEQHGAGKPALHVVHVVPSFNPGGLEQVICNLVRASSGSIQHTLVSLTDQTGLFHLIENHADLVCLNKQPGNDVKSHVRLYNLLKKLKPNTINTYNFGTLEYQATALLAGVKNRVHSMHGYGGDPSQGTSQKRNLFVKLISKIIHAYTVVSPDLKKWALETTKIAPNKVHLIFNGIDTDVFIPLNKNDDVFRIITVGRLHPVKNQALLINAYHKARQQSKLLEKSELIIIGDGELRATLEQQVNNLELSDNVTFLGYRSDTHAYLGISHLFVLSSNYEAMPMSIIEALSCETPVLCTQVGGVEYLVDDQVGWLTPNNDEERLANQIANSAEERATLKQKGINGRKQAIKSYSLAYMLKSYQTHWFGR